MNGLKLPRLCQSDELKYQVVAALAEQRVPDAADLRDVEAEAAIGAAADRAGAVAAATAFRLVTRALHAKGHVVGPALL